MKASEKVRALWSIRILFFVMGAVMMAWTPRIPEIKRSLGVDNGQFGLILMALTTGATLGNQIAGRFAHRFGTKAIISIFAFELPLTIVALSLSIHSVLATCLSLFLAGFGVVCIDVCANVQAVAIEKILERRYMVGFHGLWSIGTFASGIFGGLVSNLISPKFNIAIVALVCLALNAWAAQNCLTKEFDGHAGDGESEASIPLFGKKYAILWVFGLIIIGGALPEESVSDWSGILLHENMGIGRGLTASAFVSFAIAMVVSRLTGDRVLEKYGPIRTMRLGSLVAGTGLASGILLGVGFAHINRPVALILSSLGFIVCGLGIGPVIPAAMLSSASIPGIAPSVALGRIGVIATVAFFAGPSITGGLAQLVNLPFGMFFSVAGLFVGALATRWVKNPEK